VDKVQAGCCSPVAEQSRFDVLLTERFLQQRIIVKVNLSQRLIICGPPVGIDKAQLFRGYGFRHNYSPLPRYALGIPIHNSAHLTAFSRNKTPERKSRVSIQD